MQAVLRRVAALASALLAAGPAMAQQPGLRVQRTLEAPADASLPTFVSARRIDGIADKEVTAQTDAELRRGNISITADWMRFNNETEEVEAKGNVRLEREGTVITGPSLRLHTSDSTGEIESPDYSVAPRPRPGMPPVAARGHADRVELKGEERYSLFNATFTTCKPGDDAWYLKVDQLNLDFGRQVGTANWPTMYFKGTPILTSPYLDFSLNNQRKSGFLSPTFGSTGRSGAELSVPYYFNLAPSRDLTLTPRYMTKRGLLLGGEFRYLDPRYDGIARFEDLPKDEVRGTSRSALSLVHSYRQGPYVAGLNLNKVSDNDYFRDLSNRVNFSSQVYLVREGYARYSGTWWDSGTWGATARISGFQTLQDPNNPVPIQYSRAPQVLVNATRPDTAGMDFALAGETVDFRHPTQVTGTRTTINPSLSLPMLTPGGYFTPKFGIHSTTYSLANNAPGTPTAIQRTLPIVSADAGLAFERGSSYFGQQFVQTLEPRAYYLYVPFKDQSAIPLFDTARADFNYAQLFSENSFLGGDRVSDANQMTFALTSRLLASTTGQEALRATIGQRYYLSDQRVTLDATTAPRNFRISDWIAALSGRVAPRWTLDSAVEYNPRDSRTERLTLAARYQPEAQKTLNLSYRYLRDQFNLVDISAQWPLTAAWSGVGRYNYSVRDGRIVESLVGFEYNGGCWVGRFVAYRFAAAAGGVSTNALFLQLELNGFSRIGSNPLEILRRNVPGYTRLNQSVPPGRAFEYDNQY
jgi:LPS-assembly protein